SFGTYAVWFPRGLLLRLAARQICARLLQEWLADGEPTMPAAVEAAYQRAIEDPDLKIDALCARIEVSAALPQEGRPGEAVTGFLSRLEEQSHRSLATDDPGAWAQQTLQR